MCDLGRWFKPGQKGKVSQLDGKEEKTSIDDKKKILRKFPLMKFILISIKHCLFWEMALTLCIM